MGGIRLYRDLDGEDRELVGNIAEQYVIESTRTDPVADRVLVQRYLMRTSEGLWLSYEKVPGQGPPPRHDPIEAARRDSIVISSGADPPTPPPDEASRIWSDPVVEQVTPDYVREWFDRSGEPLPPALIADLGLAAPDPPASESPPASRDEDGWLLPQGALFGPTDPPTEPVAELIRATERVLRIAEQYNGQYPAIRNQLIDAIGAFDEASFAVEARIPDEWVGDPRHGDLPQGSAWARRVIFGIATRSGFRVRPASTPSFRACLRPYWPSEAEPPAVEIRADELDQLRCALALIKSFRTEEEAEIPSNAGSRRKRTRASRSENGVPATDTPRAARGRNRTEESATQGMSAEALTDDDRAVALLNRWLKDGRKLVMTHLASSLEVPRTQLYNRKRFPNFWKFLDTHRVAPRTGRKENGWVEADSYDNWDEIDDELDCS